MREATSKARNRGRIIRLLQEYAVEGLSIDGIERIFRAAGKMGAAHLEEDLEYLEQKGFVHRELAKDPISGIQRWMVRITAKGTDLLDGTIPPEPGIDAIV